MLHEVMPKNLCKNYSQKTLRRLMDERMPALIDAVREKSGGPCEANTWFWGGDINFRGFRPAGAYYMKNGKRVYFVRFSQHFFGRAMDLVPKQQTVAGLQGLILLNTSRFYNLGLRRMEDLEDAPTWLHFDMAPGGEDGEIRVFRA